MFVKEQRNSFDSVLLCIYKIFNGSYLQNRHQKCKCEGGLETKRTTTIEKKNKKALVSSSSFFAIGFDSLNDVEIAFFPRITLLIDIGPDIKGITHESFNFSTIDY